MTGLSTDAHSFPALAVETQRRLESLYGLEPHVPVSDFLIPHTQAEGLPGGGSRTLVTQDGDGVSLGVVFDHGVSARLHAHDPRLELSRMNLAPYCTLTEEVSHFLYLSYCAGRDRTTTQLELELVGEVDKYLTIAHVLSLQNEGALSRSLREWMFRCYRLVEGLSREEAERYRTASALADRYCGHLERNFLRSSRHRELRNEARRFYRLGPRAKLERIDSLC